MFYYFTETTDELPPGESVEVLIECPAEDDLLGTSPSAHIRVDSKPTRCEVTCFQSPTVTADGEERLPEARLSPDAPALCPVHTFLGPTVKTDGRAFVTGFSRWDEFEHGYFALQPKTKYLLRVTNTSGEPAHVITSVFLALRTPEQP